jgi:hypothetical protein
MHCVLAATSAPSEDQSAEFPVTFHDRKMQVENVSARIASTATNLSHLLPNISER